MVVQKVLSSAVCLVARLAGSRADLWAGKKAPRRVAPKAASSASLSAAYLVVEKVQTTADQMVQKWAARSVEQKVAKTGQHLVVRRAVYWAARWDAPKVVRSAE